MEMIFIFSSVSFNLNRELYEKVVVTTMKYGVETRGKSEMKCWMITINRLRIKEVRCRVDLRKNLR